MYYHIRIDYFDENLEANQTLYEFDYPSEKVVLEEVITPYVCRESFLFHGSYLSSNQLRQVRVYCTESNIYETKAKIDQQRRGSYTRPIVLGDVFGYSQYAADQTRYFINKAKESIVLEPEQSKIIKSPMVFISHNSKDIDLVESLVSMLEGIGLDQSNLFCSSVHPFGVKLNDDIFETLRSLFENHDLYVIFVMSHNFYESAASLNEMGAAWVLHTKYTMFLSDDISFDDLKGAVNKNQLTTSVNDKDLPYKLNELKDSIVEFLKLPDVDNNRWERYRDKFIKNVR